MWGTGTAITWYGTAEERHFLPSRVRRKMQGMGIKIFWSLKKKNCILVSLATAWLLAVLLWCITGSCQKGVMLITRKALKKCLLHVHVFTLSSMAGSWSQGSPAVPVWEPVWTELEHTEPWFILVCITQTYTGLNNPCELQQENVRSVTNGSGLVILQIAVFMYGRKGLGIHSRWSLNSLQRVDVAYEYEQEWKEEAKVSNSWVEIPWRWLS